MEQDSGQDVLGLLPKDEAVELERVLSRLSRLQRTAVLQSFRNAAAGRGALPNALVGVESGETEFFRVCLPTNKYQAVVDKLLAGVSQRSSRAS